MTDDRSQEPVFRYRNHALLVGAGGLALATLGWAFGSLGWMDIGSFYRAYLFGYMFWLGITLGSMAIVMLNHLTSGDWGLLIRRSGEAAALTMPLLIVLFIPIVIGAKYLYPWADPSQVANDPVLKMRSVVFNVPMWSARALIYMLIWWTLAILLRRMSVAHDASSDPAVLSRLRRVSAAGLVIYFVTMTLASMDWMMSRETHWYSSVFGFIVIIGQGLSGLVFMLVILRSMAEREPFRSAARPSMFNDLGNLLLVFVILWAYVSFSQLLVTWMGNTQEDVVWYVQRIRGGWKWVSIALIAIHFFVPFLLLLGKSNKQRIEVLGTLAAALLFLRLLDVLYLVVPSGPTEQGNGISWIVFFTPLGIGGIWFATFLWFLRNRPLMPLGQQVSPPEEKHGHAEHRTLPVAG
jgi:hypothetical protein